MKSSCQNVDKCLGLSCEKKGKKSENVTEIDDRVDDEVVQTITKDQVEGRGRRRVTIKKGGVFRVTRGVL